MKAFALKAQVGVRQQRASESQHLQRIKSMEAFRRQEEQGFELILKDDCAWALCCCAPVKECKPGVSQTEDNKQQNITPAQQTQTKRRMV